MALSGDLLCDLCAVVCVVNWTHYARFSPSDPMFWTICFEFEYRFLV